MNAIPPVARIEGRPLKGGWSKVMLLVQAHEPVRKNALLRHVRRPDSTKRQDDTWLAHRVTELMAEGYLTRIDGHLRLTRAGLEAIAERAARKAAEQGATYD